ncbi:hypothetical protein IMAU60055_01247 [Lactiplantibacillus plantarum]|nr:hypothetical protein [Lactiplantibacillus plantarum]
MFERPSSCMGGGRFLGLLVKYIVHTTLTIYIYNSVILLK